MANTCAVVVCAIVLAVMLLVINTGGDGLCGEPADHFHPCASGYCEGLLVEKLGAVVRVPGCGDPCLQRAHLSCRLRHAFAESLHGQPYASTLIPAAFDTWTRDRPLFFVFAGDHGTGKTKAAMLMAREMFVGEGEALPAGLLRLDGWELRLGSDEEPTAEQLKERIALLHGQILAQLRRCPGSLLVLDELQQVHPAIVRSLRRFSETTYVIDSATGERISTASAVFVLISDFGREGLSKEMGREELVARVRALLDVVYDADAAPRDSVSAMVAHAVPFLPLGGEALSEVARSLCRELAALPGLAEAGLAAVVVSPEARAPLVARASDVRGGRALRYGRAVEEAVRALVAEPLAEEIAARTNELAVAAAAAARASWWPRLGGGAAVPRLYAHVQAADGGGVTVRVYDQTKAFCAATGGDRDALASETAARRGGAGEQGFAEL